MEGILQPEMSYGVTPQQRACSEIIICPGLCWLARI